MELIKAIWIIHRSFIISRLMTIRSSKQTFYPIKRLLCETCIANDIWHDKVCHLNVLIAPLFFYSFFLNWFSLIFFSRYCLTSFCIFPFFLNNSHTFILFLIFFFFLNNFSFSLSFHSFFWSFYLSFHFSSFLLNKSHFPSVSSYLSLFLNIYSYSNFLSW